MTRPVEGKGGTVVQMFERSRNVEALRTGLGKQQFAKHQVSYVLGQAIVMEAAGKGLTAGRKNELLGHIDVVRQALATGAFIDGEAHPVYAMEVAGYGRGITGDAAGIESFASLGRRLASASNYVGGVVFVLLAVCLTLGLVFLGRVMHARSLEEAADPVAQERATEKLRQGVVGNPSEVPFVNTSNSGDIEKLIRGIELSGVLAAKKASGG